MSDTILSIAFVLFGVGVWAAIFAAGDERAVAERACAERCHPYVWAMSPDGVCVCASAEVPDAH